MKHWRADPTADARPSWHDRSPDIDAQRLIWEQEDATRLHALLDKHNGPPRDGFQPGDLPCPQCHGQRIVQDHYDYVRGESGVIHSCDYCLGSGTR